MSSSRVAFFKNISLESVDADQSAAITSLGNQLSSLTSHVDSKASKAYVDDELVTKLMVKADVVAVNALLDTKANSTDVNEALALKASEASVTAAVADFNTSLAITNNVMAGKANASDLTPINTSIASLNNSVALKLDATVHNARVSAENEFLNAFKDAINLSNADNSGEYDYTDLGLSAPAAPGVAPE
jgi:hypothetical protein